MRSRAIFRLMSCLALAGVLGGCAAPPAIPSTATRGPSADPSAAASPAVATSPAATRLLGTVVTMTVDGASHPVSQPVRASGQLPTTVVLTFPFAVDRAGVEQWLPRSASASWTDDRTLQLVFASADAPIGFKVPETRAAVGGGVIDWFTVHISFPDARLVQIFTVAGITAERAPRPALSVRAPRGDGLTLSPDGKTIVVFDGFGPDTGPQPTLFDVDTRASTSLGAPLAAEGWFSFADWLPDGRLAMVGRSVWIGDARGGMRRIADAQAAAGGYPWLAVPDPSGRHLALWAYNADGHIAVVDLRDGTTRRITGPFRRSCADCGISLVWSADGTLLAGTDSDEEAGPAATRVRVVDVARDRTVRTLEQDVWRIDALANGEMIVVRGPVETGAGGRWLGIRAGFDLVEKARYLGCAWTMSRDGRYLLQSECGGGAGHPPQTLLDLETGGAHTFVVQGPGTPRWLADGRLAIY